MSSTVAETVTVKPQTNNKGKKNQNANANAQRKYKLDRSARKRSKSFSGLVKIKSMKPVLPTKFLLGGNINDPLNLNSLQDEEINRAMNAVTPKSSPIPTPPQRKGKVEVIIPSNIHDPLNLIDCADDAEYEQQLTSPVKKCRKKRLKRKRTVSATLEMTRTDEVDTIVEAKTPEPSRDSAKVPENDENSNKETVVTAQPEEKPKELALELSPKKDNKKRKSEDHKDAVKKFKFTNADKIVSPVIPQPGAWLKRKTAAQTQKPKPQQKKDINEKLPVFKEKDRKFQYGNYNRYYGYRNPTNDLDNRLICLSYHRYIFEGKDILDIGCNIGHITLCVARDFGAKTVLGIDIDKNLIGVARKNIKHYVNNTPPVVNNIMDRSGDKRRLKKQNCEFFPISMPILYGPIDIPGINTGDAPQAFPNNVTFKQSNYILEDDSLLGLEQPQFDVILCLSVTKWMHLNWGDDGLKQAFRRMYSQLRPGGKLILEPQNWASYKKKKNLTETIYRNYHSIEFFPDKFMEYLLSPMVGFAKSEVLCYPPHQNKGFQRYIYIYTKSTMFPSERVECPPTPFACGGGGGGGGSTNHHQGEEDDPIVSLRSGSSNSGFAVNVEYSERDSEEREEVYVNGNGCGGSSPPAREDSPSSPSRAASRVSGQLPVEDEDSRISGLVPVEGEEEGGVVVDQQQNGVYVNGVGSSPSQPSENGVVVVVANGEEENLSGDNT